MDSADASDADVLGVKLPERTDAELLFDKEGTYQMFWRI